jgi:hypothetical protein
MRMARLVIGLLVDWSDLILVCYLAMGMMVLFAFAFAADGLAPRCPAVPATQALIKEQGRGTAEVTAAPGLDRHGAVATIPWPALAGSEATQAAQGAGRP